MIAESLLRGVLEAHGDAVECAVWFGSTARGEATPLTDVDLAVRFAPRLDAHARFRLRARISGELWERAEGRAVDVVDLDDAPAALAYRIIREGRLLVCRDEGQWREFQVRTRDHYFDLEPLWALHRTYMKRQLLEGTYLG